MRVDIPITVSPYGRGGASTRVRIHDWFGHFGLEYEPHSYLGASSNPPRTMLRALPRVIRAEYELRSLRSRVSDRVLLLSREATPLSNGSLERSLLSRAGHGVYDFDDALFHDDAGLSRKIWSKARVWTRALEAADVVIAGSESLAEAAEGASGEIFMIPSCVEPDAYEKKVAFEVGELPRAVWIGTPATEHLLASITRPLIELNAQFGLRLTVISAGARTLGELDRIVDRVEWNAKSYGSQLAEADFGIMPLPDTPYTRGKCAYKLLQFGAVGLPTIASPVGANAKAISRLGGFAATSDDEWFDAGAALIGSSSAARAGLGAQAVGAVTRHYSFGAWEKEWLTAMSLPPVGSAQLQGNGE